MDVGKNVLEATEGKCLLWCGHIKRVPGNRLSQRIVEWEPGRTWRKGRAKEGRIDGLRWRITKQSVTEDITGDSDMWRNFGWKELIAEWIILGWMDGRMSEWKNEWMSNWLIGWMNGCMNIKIYLLTAIGLSPGGSSTVHIYTQTIRRTTQLSNWEECRPCPVFARYTLAFVLQLRQSTEKPQSG